MRCRAWCARTTVTKVRSSKKRTYAVNVKVSTAGAHHRGAVRIAGKAYAKKVMTFDGTGIYFHVARVCSTFSASIGVPDGSSDTAELLALTQKKTDLSDEPVPTFTQVSAGQAPRAVRQSLTGVTLLGIGAGDGVLSVIDPRVRCTVNTLTAPPCGVA
ncbi:hypothetical protein [Aeromicrobium duanguangcaii]|uniref:Uncharacterized protein n=1 Tax=Aeromicrobium duanguangcaii TaxID=2968086 RepID=A0ABY5KDL6_9ACTN|nr:hypothetical protein [Aeromicrobium duanguangcaii]MCD9154382.1 hypothetical protein [Aeromicrobium duanguangcaii]UUI68552.1 hypothetical protein NP095_00100 [Aeromicrobium duanguangcaii]